MQIICLGEALIDFKANDSLAFQGYVGGSPLNVAVAASRLGAKTGFASQLSSDLFGHHIRRYLHDNGIDTRFVLESDAPSTLAFVDEVDGEAHFTFRAQGAADTLYHPQPRPEFPADVKFILFGSISLLTEPASSAITDVVQHHRDRCTTVFDPNVRPALIDDRKRYLERLESWLSLAHIVKVSTQDLRWLYPGVLVHEVARLWLSFGPQAIVVTQGEGGASLFRIDHEEVRVQAPAVRVIDTVGAGDTFTGALMVSLLENASPIEVLPKHAWRSALTYAAAAAALNCTRSGADPPDRKALEEFMASRESF